MSVAWAGNNHQIISFIHGGIRHAGVTHGVAQFYRYAAADNADKGNKARALSLVLAGGILATFLGPNLTRLTYLAIPDHLYAGCFFAAAVVQACALLTLPFLRIKPLL